MYLRLTDDQHYDSDDQSNDPSGAGGGHHHRFLVDVTEPALHRRLTDTVVTKLQVAPV